jgi:hypothetical protein
MMRLLPFIVAFASTVVGQDSSTGAPESIKQVPPPWTLRGTVYTLTMTPLDKLPVKAYSPLERQSANTTAGTYKGILGTIQIIRYKDSPVGPYDELLIIPGFFQYPYTNAARSVEKKSNIRVSRIYVSQKYTCWNGRTSKFNPTGKEGGEKKYHIISLISPPRLEYPKALGKVRLD